MDISPNIIDGAVIGLVLLSAIMAWARGLTREVLGLMGWALAAAGATALTPMIMPLMPKLPVLGAILAKNCTLSMLAAFSVGVAALLVAIGLLSRLLGEAVRRSALGGIDKALGFLFGVARGVAIIAVVAWGAQIVAPSLDKSDAFQQARTGGFIMDARNALGAMLPTEVPPWASGRIDRIMAHCAAPTAPATEAGPASAPAQ